MLRDSKYFISLVAVTVLTACQGGPYRTSPSAPGTCPSLQIGFLSEPSGAAIIPGLANDHLWRAVDESGTEYVANVDFIPQMGWGVPSHMKAIAFDQWTHLSSGYTPTGGGIVNYVLEYTLPAAQCDMGVTWDTRLTIALPNGVCATDEGTPGICKSGGEVAAKLDMVAISDPAGTMSVTGAGRAALAQAITAALGTVVMRRRIATSSNTQSNLRQSDYITDNFQVAQGVRAHVYVGAALAIMKTSPGWGCLKECTSVPNPQLMEHGFVSVDGGRGSGIAVAMARRTP